MSTLILYMKSGNIIKVPRVTEWHIKTADTGITSLKIIKNNRLFCHKRGLIMTSLDLTQIEAIEEI